MKRKKSVVLLLSLSCATTTIGYASWVANYYYNYVQTNKVQDVPVAYIIGKEDVKYTKIEKALEVAQSGDIVCVIPPTKENYNSSTNPTLPDSVTYEITRNCEIKEGVTLFIPTDQASVEKVKDASSLSSYIDYLKKPIRDQGSTDYEKFADENKSKYLRVTVEISSGVTLKNNGVLLISGFLSGGTNGSGGVGQTSHSYSNIVLNTGSSIVQDCDNASTYCFGFIEEKSSDNNSLFDLRKGNLYVPVIINDYRGFNYSFAMTDGAINTERCSAFNEMEFRNIKSRTQISYYSSVYGLINIYVKYDSLSVDETIFIEKGVVGKDNNFLIQLTDSNYSSIDYKYDSINKKFKAKCYGGFTFNYLTLNLSLKGQTLNLSTQNAYFPLSYKFDVELLCSKNQEIATFDINNQRMKIMTGCNIYLGDNVNLIGNELIVYSAFYDGTKGNGQGVQNSGRKAYPLKENGILRMATNAKITMNKIAGTIYCDNSDNISATTTSITSKEPWNIGSSGKLNPPWTILNFLELSEQLFVVPIENLNKEKLCVGVNTFTNTNSFKPQFDVLIDSGNQSINVNGIQRVIFCDSIENFGFNFISNIYKVYSNTTQYEMNSYVMYNSANRLIGITNSDRSILSNNNGVNEFEVQKIEIFGDTHDVPQGTVLQLDKNIVDFDKVYDKNFVWSSLDTSICTVDQNGLVTAEQIGNTYIKLSCGEVYALYEINVISPTSVESVQSVTIVESTNKVSNAEFKDGKYVFNAKIIGENGSELSLDDISSITWTIKPEAAGRAYFDSDANLVEKNDTLTVNVTLKGGLNASNQMGATPDKVALNCKVVDKKGNVINASTFTLVNNNTCFEKGTLVTTNRGLIPVENLKPSDLIKSYNHETGTYEYKPIAALIDHGEKIYKVINLDFSDGSNIGFITCHGLFDLDENKYVDINENNYLNYIGHRFAKGLGSEYEEIVLVNASIIEKITNSYTVLSSENINCEANGILNITSVLVGIYNIFDYDKNHNFDITLMKQDIERYGLYTYDDFKDRIDEKKFYDLGFKYFKVAIGKGILTDKILQFYIDWFYECIKNGEAIIY
ncbi:MAG: Ig-like domain-containing protein [Acholeplasmatales bacterium]|nr:Ig-like domain-containing protein [Acholeplasmatales bacterium]